MRAIVRRFVPYSVKRHIQNTYAKLKYGVNIGRGSHVHKVEFESNCRVGEFAQFMGSSMGHASYLGNGSIVCFAKIGRYCAIGDNVRICLGNHPTSKIVSIHPCFYSLEGNTIQSYIKQQLFAEHKYVDNEKKFVCSIGNDVWIGNNVNIMDGITIGDGAIIGVGAVVTHDVEPYSVVAGVPAKKLKYRFTSEQIEFLIKFKWWEHDETWLIKNAHLFSDINKFIDSCKQNT